MGPEIVGHAWCNGCDKPFLTRDIVRSVSMCHECAAKLSEVKIEVDGRTFALSLRRKRRMGHSAAKIAHREAAKRLIREQRARYDELVAEEKKIALVNLAAADLHCLTVPLGAQH